LRWWEEQGGWLRIWLAFWAELDGQRRLRWSEAFIDGSFAAAKKGGQPLARAISPCRKAHREQARHNGTRFSRREVSATSEAGRLKAHVSQRYLLEKKAPGTSDHLSPCISQPLPQE